MRGFNFAKSHFNEADVPWLIELFNRLMAGEWRTLHDMARDELLPRYPFTRESRAAASYRDLMGRMGYAVPRVGGKPKGAGSRIPESDWADIAELYEQGNDSLQIAQMLGGWDYPSERHAAAAVRKVVAHQGAMRRYTPKHTTDEMLYGGAVYWREHGEMPRPSVLKQTPGKRPKGLHAYSTIEHRFGTVQDYYRQLGRHIRDLGWADHTPVQPAVKRGKPFFTYTDAERMHTLYRSGMATIEIAEQVYKRFGYRSATVAANSINRAFRHYNMPMRTRAEAARLWRIRHGEQQAGLLSDEVLRNMRTLYEQGASLIDLSAAYSADLGYRTQASCAGSISNAFKKKGWPIRGRAESNSIRSAFQVAYAHEKGKRCRKQESDQSEAPATPRARATAPMTPRPPAQPAPSVLAGVTATP